MRRKTRRIPHSSSDPPAILVEVDCACQKGGRSAAAAAGGSSAVRAAAPLRMPSAAGEGTWQVDGKGVEERERERGMEGEAEGGGLCVEVSDEEVRRGEATKN